MKMEVNEVLENYERRIKRLEEEMEKITGSPNQIQNPNHLIFSDRKLEHNKLLEELLKSDYCHSKNGLSFGEILQIFNENNRPVNSKKIRDLLAVWKKRKKIEAIKSEGVLRYFWIENE